MGNVLILVGEPGVGKSTLIDEAFGGYQRVLVDHKKAGGPAREILYEPTFRVIMGAELGARAGRHPDGYPGTDAMSMSAITVVDEWLREGADDLPLIIAEGTRLANLRFVQACHAGLHHLTVVHLFGSTEAAQRRDDRGSKQNPRWLKGRQTAARNFTLLAQAEEFTHPRTVTVRDIAASAPLDESAIMLRSLAGLRNPLVS